MIRPEALPAKPSARSSVEAEGTIFYRWALTAAERGALEAEGWQEVARHPFHGTSALMRFDRQEALTAEGLGEG
jgi:hypothetical protein